MKLQNPFLSPLVSYKRDLNFYEHYVKDQALILSLQTGKALDFCLDWVRQKTSPGAELGIVDPKITYLAQVTEGNRVLKEGTMTEYLRMVQLRNYPMAPTFTAYESVERRESVLAKYIAEQLANRSKNKKLKLKYENQGNKLLAGIYNNRQNRNKIKNNSVSGAHGTKASVLFLQSAHSTLTSTCRSASSTTNANMERFLTGNRHYWSHTVALNNIASVLNNVDLGLIEEVMQEYCIEYPSQSEVLAAIKRCTDLYWLAEYNPDRFDKIKKTVAGLSPLQCAAFLFCGDLYHLERYASHAIRDLFSYLTDLPTEPIENPEEWIKQLGGDEIALISINCDRWIEADGKDRHLFTNATKESPNFGLIGATAKRIIEGITKYAKLIKAFFGCNIMPCGMSYFPFSIRRTVVASDTDSSIFTTQDWVEWYVGRLDCTPDSARANAATTYLCSLYTTHVLAQLSANMGVAERHMGLLEMKNEYAFPVFGLTSMGKHYFAAMSSQEGNVYPKPKWEIKGANMKNSKAPPAVMKKAEEMIIRILTEVMNGGEIDLREILRDIAKEELLVKRQLLAGNANFFSTGQIKAKSSYKSDNSPYLHYELWEEVFAPKYGSTQPPPYASIKVSLDLDNPTKLKEWLLQMEDRALATRLENWLAKNGKTALGTIHLPRLVLGQAGIPAELVDRMAIRELVFGIMSTYYMLIESLGVYMRDDSITRLLTDDYHEEAALEVIVETLQAA